MSDKVVIGYWGIRGRAQVLRHIASYCGLNFEDKIYTSPEQYQGDYTSIGDFPNLPYIQDGDFFMSETLGCAIYLARRGGKP